ncbi:RagB/SusD family nutrient uptake outer membrane protein [Aquirufa sp. ROCK2-A2]
MKKNNYFVKRSKIALATALVALLGVACKDNFLEIKPAGAISEAQLSTKAGIEGSLIAAYSMISGSGTRMVHPWNWVWGSVRGGDANKGTDPGDFSDINPIQTFKYQSTQGVISDNYRGLYEIIARSNNVLRLVKVATSEVTADDKKRISAEAKFLRAHAYFSLKRNYNNTPYVDETQDLTVVKNDKDLWPLIEADMQFAYDNLPATQGAAGRANKWAAAAYLGKIKLYQKKYGDAKALFDAVIANGVTANGKKYALVPKFGDLFKASNDNNEESIFAVQAAANTGSVNNANSDGDLNWPYNTGPNGPGNCCGFFQPSFELVNSYRTDGSGLPLLDGSYNVGANQVVSDMGKLSSDAFTPDAGSLDPRLDWTVGRRGIPFLDWQDHPGNDWIRNQSNGGPFSPKKYSYYKTDKGSLQDNSSWTPGYTALNYTVIRFADVLLMAAECEVEVGSLAKAQEYVNLIRTRAANSAGFVKRGAADAANYNISTYSSAWTDKAAARKAVQFERKLELAMEGHRFFDLVRWGTDIAEINAYLKYEAAPGRLPNTLGGSTYEAKHAILPIPQAEIDLVNVKDKIITQNSGY